MKFVFFWLLSFSALSMPMYNKTSLVIPKGISYNSKKMQETAKILASLQLFADSKDKDLYYYVPTFRILPYEEGSGGSLLNYQNIEYYEKANKAYNQANDDSYKDSPWISTELAFLKEHIDKQSININNQIASLQRIIDDMTQISKEDMKKIENKILKIETRIENLKDKADEAKFTGNKDFLDYLEQKIKEEEQNIEKEQQKIFIFQEKINKEQEKLTALHDSLKIRSAELVQEYKMNRLDAAKAFLHVIGIDIERSDCFEQFNAAVSKGLEKTNEISAGLFSMTVYAGFTKDELDAIARYKQLVPNTRILLMPSYNFSFGSNFDIGSQKGLLKESKMFSGSEGFGAYNGATVTFYLTLAGYKSLKLSLDPFIVPLSISAETTFQLEPFRAHLKCDYRYGYKIKGRSDIIDGAIIFDNDISNQINLEDISGNNGCKFDYVGGDKKSAHYYALESIKNRLQASYLKKVELSSSQKQKYYEQMQEDIKSQQFRATYEKSKINLWESFMSLDWTTLAMDAAIMLSDTFWHTRKEDVEDRKSTRLNSSHIPLSRMPSSA